MKSNSGFSLHVAWLLLHPYVSITFTGFTKTLLLTNQQPACLIFSLCCSTLPGVCTFCPLPPIWDTLRIQVFNVEHSDWFKQNRHTSKSIFRANIDICVSNRSHNNSDAINIVLILMFYKCTFPIRVAFTVPSNCYYHVHKHTNTLELKFTQRLMSGMTATQLCVCAWVSWTQTIGQLYWWNRSLSPGLLLTFSISLCSLVMPLLPFIFPFCSGELRKWGSIYSPRAGLIRSDFVHLFSQLLTSFLLSLQHL